MEISTFAEPIFLEEVKVHYNCLTSRRMKVLKRLGNGTFGSVHAVKDIDLDGQVDPCERAVKQIEYFMECTIDNAKYEVKVLNKLRTTGAVNVTILRGAWEGVSRLSFYLLFDLYKGGSLLDFWNDPLVINLEFKEKHKMLCSIMKGVLLGLESIHERSWIIHRDLKPQNILVNQSAQDLISKIAENGDVSSAFHLSDFGNSMILKCKTEKKTGEFCSWWFQSPQMARNIPYGIEQDIWSFGIILKSMLTNINENPIGDKRVLLMKEPRNYIGVDILQPPFWYVVFRCLSEREEERPSASDILSEMVSLENFFP